MREIKFRAWDKKFGCMYEWKDFMSLDLITKQYIQDCPANAVTEGCVESTDDLIFMQFTGLNDSKGVEVYEGDYLKCTLGNYHGLCEWVWNEGRFVIRHLDKSAYHGEAIEIGNCQYNWDIIGNIYENNELIKL